MHIDCYKILYMEWQLRCCGMCINLLQYNGQKRNYSNAKFPFPFGDYTDLLWWMWFKQLVLPIDH